MIVLPLLAASGGFWAPIANPLAAVLAFFYSLVPNYGIAIVLLTIAMMIVLTPLTIKQTRSMLVMQKLQPEMKKLQEQHKNDRQALNEAVMALYKEHNASPLGGCLPMLLPFPLFIGLLRVLEGLSHTVKDPRTKIVTAVPKYLSPHTRMYQDIVKAHGQLDAFGMNLAKSARNVGGGFGHSLPYFVLLLVMVGTQFYQQYQLTSKNPAAQAQPGQAMMMKFIPLFFGFISLQFPAGVVLYWTVSNVIRIGQQWGLYRFDPKVKALVAKDVKEIEAKTREIDAQESKASGRSRLRDRLADVADAASDLRGRGGKNDAKPGTSGAGNKNGAPGRGNRTPPGKATGVASGVAKSQRPKSQGPGAKPTGTQNTQKGTPQRPAAPKGGLPKGAPLKPGGAKPAGSGGAGGAKPGATRPGASRSGAPGGGNQKAGPTQAAPSKPAAAARPGAGSSVPVARAKPTNGTNGGGVKNPDDKSPAAKIAAVSPAPDSTGQGNGTAKPGGAEGSDAVEAGAGAGPGNSTATTAAKGRAGGGRTGGGSARNVSSRRRRKGR